MMAWWKRKPSRPPQQFVPQTITFVGEQDGLPERELKALLSELFRRVPAVERAYLARAGYGNGSGEHVVLCVNHSAGVDESLNHMIAGIFADLFGSHEHLDILFLRSDQEQALQLVCRSFYVAH